MPIHKLPIEKKLSGNKSRNGRTAKEGTLTDPTAPFRFSSFRLRLCLPSFFPCIVQLRANVSSVCPVKMSSQSFARDEEYDIDVIGGNLSDASGIERDDAFLASEPAKENQ